MKFLTVFLIVTGIIFFFNMAGFATNSGAFVSGFMNNGFGYFTSSEFWNLNCSSFSSCTSNIPLMLGAAVGVGVVASLFGRSPDISYVKAGVVAALMTIIVIEMGALWIVISPIVEGWVERAVNLIMFLITGAFIISGVSWWTGSDG